jgi:hypothetical protein
MGETKIKEKRRTLYLNEASVKEKRGKFMFEA